MTNYARHKHYLHWFAAHYHIKGSCEISALSLKDCLNKGRKGEKTHTCFFFYKHKVYKHTEAQISKKLSIFQACFWASFLYIKNENQLITLIVVLR